MYVSIYLERQYPPSLRGAPLPSPSRPLFLFLLFSARVLFGFKSEKNHERLASLIGWLSGDDSGDLGVFTSHRTGFPS